MALSTPKKAQKPADTRVERLTRISPHDMLDLCDATESAIKSGGGFGWTDVPERDVMQRFWEGVIAMPLRELFVARLDDVICGTTQLIRPAQNNQAQAHAADMISTFVAPWARGYGLARKMIETAENYAKKNGISVINLDVRETQTAAIQLYETMDYKLVGLHPHYAHIDGKPVRGYYYYKEL